MYCSIKYITSLLQAMCSIVLNKTDPLQAWCRHNIKYAVKGTGLAQAKFILQACKCFSRYTAGLQSPSLPGLRQACILKQVCYRHYIQLNRMLTGLSQYKIFVRDMYTNILVPWIATTVNVNALTLYTAMFRCLVNVNGHTRFRTRHLFSLLINELDHK